MDLAYDHIQENAYPSDRKESNETPKPDGEQSSSLNNDIQDAYKAISTSAWGVKIGGFLGNVMKQVRLFVASSHESCLHSTGPRAAADNMTLGRVGLCAGAEGTCRGWRRCNKRAHRPARIANQPNANDIAEHRGGR